jgi:hypothetical protein
MRQLRISQITIAYRRPFQQSVRKVNADHICTVDACVGEICVNQNSSFEVAAIEVRIA